MRVPQDDIALNLIHIRATHTNNGIELFMLTDMRKLLTNSCAEPLCKRPDRTYIDLASRAYLSRH